MSEDDGQRARQVLTARLREGVRRFGAALAAARLQHEVTVTTEALAPAADGLSTRPVTLRRGDRMALPSATEEVWVVVRGALRLMTLAGVTTAHAGEVVHVPENVPGHAEAVEETAIVAVAAETPP